MTCDRVRELIPDCVAGRLDAPTRGNVIEHTETCSACRADMAELGAVWRGLESMQEPEPGPGLKSRFLETLRAYQEGYQEGQRRPAVVKPVASGFWSGWIPAQPAWQVAFAVVLLGVGLAAGRYALTPRQDAGGNPQIAVLQGQVENLRQLVALSLLQEQSPSARLRGVTYSYQVAQPDRQVEQALLQAVNRDNNVNVRLSAVDALAKFSGSPDVRRALIDSVAVQDSPLVQIALIDLLVQIGATDAAPALRKVAASSEANQDVRQRAEAALQKLEVRK
jgi:hypothetical protein